VQPAAHQANIDYSESARIKESANSKAGGTDQVSRPGRAEATSSYCPELRNILNDFGPMSVVQYWVARTPYRREGLHEWNNNE